MINRKKSFRDEFIGKEIKVICGEKTIEGLVLDETKETITIETDSKKKLLKSGLRIIGINGEEVDIDGKKINVRPHERIKLRSKWIKQKH